MINCSVGILTKNSSRTLERCLSSLKEVAEIIVADGGSSDETLAIAKKFNCKIIKQINSEGIIDDFSRERNHILEFASQPWFFYLDSDEIATPALLDDLKKVCQTNNDKVAYKVAYYLTTPNGEDVYFEFAKAKQIRLFRTNLGIKFIKKVHERPDVSLFQDKIGVIKSFWLVPLDQQLDFKVYYSKISSRLSLKIKEIKFKNFADYLFRGILVPLRQLFSTITRAILSRLIKPLAKHIPWKYEFYRMYSSWYYLINFFLKYFGIKSYD